jgi:protein SMG9
LKKEEETFLISSEDNMNNCRHQTKGIDISTYNNNRIIFLDTQPLFSPSIVSQMIKSESKVPLTSDFASFEHLHDMQASDHKRIKVLTFLKSIQLSVFLLSVCHIVLVVDDSYPDLNFWKYLNTVDMLR